MGIGVLVGEGGLVGVNVCVGVGVVELVDPLSSSIPALGGVVVVSVVTDGLGLSAELDSRADLTPQALCEQSAASKTIARKPNQRASLRLGFSIM